MPPRKTELPPPPPNPAEWIAIDSLLPFPGNAKVGDVDAIVESIEKNGVYRPLYVQVSTRHIMAGNHTLKALKRMGQTHVWVWWYACDDETAERINLADNGIPELGGYNQEALVAQLSKLPSLEGTGWNADRLLKLTGAKPQDLDDQLGAVPDDAYESQLGVVAVCETPEQQQTVYDHLMKMTKTEPAFVGVELKIVAV